MVNICRCRKVCLLFIQLFEDEVNTLVDHIRSKLCVSTMFAVYKIANLWLTEFDRPLNCREFDEMNMMKLNGIPCEYGGFHSFDILFWLHFVTVWVGGHWTQNHEIPFKFIKRWMFYFIAIYVEKKLRKNDHTDVKLYVSNVFYITTSAILMTSHTTALCCHWEVLLVYISRRLDH